MAALLFVCEKIKRLPEQNDVDLDQKGTGDLARCLKFYP
jgi:hypothetical protein